MNCGRFFFKFFFVFTLPIGKFVTFILVAPNKYVVIGTLSARYSDLN